MKKIEFTMQVIGLIIMLPLYVFLELNHGSAKSPSIYESSAVVQDQEKANATATANIK